MIILSGICPVPIVSPMRFTQGQNYQFFAALPAAGRVNTQLNLTLPARKGRFALQNADTKAGAGRKYREEKMVSKIRIIIPLIVLSIVSVFPSGLCAQASKSEKFIVVLDPGHGGNDPGTLGTRRTRTYEKHVVLSVALKLQDMLRDSLPDVRVILTRSTDRYPSFRERVDAANKNRADLFISIHCNATANGVAYGAETYVMATNKADANLEISKTENAPMLMEENYRDIYKGFDPNDLESNIGKNIEQFANVKHSIAFAALAQEGMHRIGGRKDLGVKQAVLYVTYATIVPAVLVELGFLSNRTEETFLHSENGQRLMALSLFDAIRKYKARFYDPLHAHADTDTPSPSNDSPSQLAAQVASGSEPSASAKDNTVRYCVQLTASPSKLDLKTNVLLKKFQGVSFYRENGMYKYIASGVPTYEQALRELSQARQKGAKDAFVVAFQGERKIDLKTARALSGE